MYRLQFVYVLVPYPYFVPEIAYCDMGKPKPLLKDINFLPKIVNTGQSLAGQILEHEPPFVLFVIFS